MKLISFNIALFEKNNQLLRQFLKTEQPDILCFQEVVRRIDQTVDPDWVSLDVVDQATPDLKYSFFAPLCIVSNFSTKNFHGHRHFQVDLGGKVEYGNYIKTKYPIIKGENIFLHHHFTYVTDWSNWPKEDYRAVQVATINLGKKSLRLINYHGLWSRDKKDSQLAKKACATILKIASVDNRPTIICGDFNLFPDTDAIKLFDKKFINLINRFNIKTTRPAHHQLNHKQRNVVDYIFISHNLRLNHFFVLEKQLSDHLPLILDFDV